MGYIQQSDNKKIYAYLTQTGKEKVLVGDISDFEIKYFSLHDDDINYKVSSKIYSTNYNTLKSGFVPDITGDDNICLPNISDATFLQKNQLIYDVIIPQPPDPEEPPAEISIEGVCNTDTEKFEITVIKTVDFANCTFDVKVETITFPNSTSTIADAQILKTENVNNNELTATITTNGTIGKTTLSLNATCKRTLTVNGNTFVCLLGEDFFPRKADAFNFTVTLKDATGNILQTKEFKDINCSKKLFAAYPLPPSALLESDAANLPEFTPPYVYNSPTAPDDFFPLPDDVSDYILPGTKGGFALWVLDNGNRRRDLNITQADLDADDAGSQAFKNKFLFRMDNQSTGVDQLINLQKVDFNVIFDKRYYNPNEFYPNYNIVDSVITEPTFIRSPLMPNDVWQDIAPTVATDGNYTSIRPLSYNPASFTERFDSLNPTVALFNDWKNGNSGFNLIYYEFAPKGYPPPANVPPFKKRTNNFSGVLVTDGFDQGNARIYNNHYGLDTSLVLGSLGIAPDNSMPFIFGYCVTSNQGVNC